jgi:hypothetical protein
LCTAEFGDFVKRRQRRHCEKPERRSNPDFQNDENCEIARRNDTFLVLLPLHDAFNFTRKMLKCFYAINLR